MPFVISNSVREECARDSSDLPVFRTRSVIIPKSGKEDAGRDSDTNRSCGRDAVVNKPYRPLGSMQSVLELEIVKTRTEEEEERIGFNRYGRQKRRREDGGAASAIKIVGEGRSKVSSNNNNDGGKNEADESRDVPKGTIKMLVANKDQQDQDGREAADSVDLAREIWSLRKVCTRETSGYHTLGYKEIHKQLKQGQNRISMVKAGGSFYNKSSRKDPMTIARWASDMVIVCDQHRNEADAVLLERKPQGQGRNPQRGGNRHEEPKHARAGPLRQNLHYEGHPELSETGNNNTSAQKRPLGARTMGFHHQNTNDATCTARKLRLADRLKSEFDSISSKGRPKVVKSQKSNRKLGDVKIQRSNNKLGEAQPPTDNSADGDAYRDEGGASPKSANKIRGAKSPQGVQSFGASGTGLVAKGASGGPNSPLAGSALKTLDCDKQGGAQAPKDEKVHRGSVSSLASSVGTCLVQSSGGEATIGSRATSTKGVALDDKARKRLPKYVLQFPRQTAQVKAHQELVKKLTHGESAGTNIKLASSSAAAAAAIAAAAAATAAAAPGKGAAAAEAAASATAAAETAAAAAAGITSAEFARSAAEHEKILAKVQEMALTSKDLKDSILDRTADFCSIKQGLENRLDERIRRSDFSRGDEYRRKFVALNIILNQGTYKLTGREGRPVEKLEASQQLAVLRQTCGELRSVQKQYNLSHSTWYQTLLTKCKEMTGGGTLGLPEQKFLAALRHLIIDGYSLTPELFKEVILVGVMPQDHRRQGLQRLIALIRDNVLKMDLEDYIVFINKNRLFAPKSLLDKVTELRLKNKKPSLTAGMRAAAMAMKWKRRSVNAVASRKGLSGFGIGTSSFAGNLNIVSTNSPS